jgi:hypothetical protein
MLRSLGSGQRSIRELAAPFQMSFAAASKNPRVLEAVGLVQGTVQGRSHLLRIEPSPRAAANEWLRFYERFWIERLDGPDAVLKAERRAAETKSKTKGHHNHEDPAK